MIRSSDYERILRYIRSCISKLILGSIPRQVLGSIHRYTVSIVSRIVLRYIFRFSGRRWIKKFSSCFRFSHLPSPLQNMGSVRKLCSLSWPQFFYAIEEKGTNYFILNLCMLHFFSAQGRRKKSCVIINVIIAVQKIHYKISIKIFRNRMKKIQLFLDIKKLKYLNSCIVNCWHQDYRLSQ